MMLNRGILFLSEAMPGNIRKAEFFINFTRRFNEYLKVRVHPVDLSHWPHPLVPVADATAGPARGVRDSDLLPPAHSSDHLRGQETTQASHTLCHTHYLHFSMFARATLSTL